MTDFVTEYRTPLLACAATIGLLLLVQSASAAMGDLAAIAMLAYMAAAAVTAYRYATRTAKPAPAASPQAATDTTTDDRGARIAELESLLAQEQLVVAALMDQLSPDQAA